MDRLIGFAIVAAIMAGLVHATSISHPSAGQVTVYMLSCDAERIAGTCRGIERTGTPFTYEASIDEQSVSYRAADGSNRSFSFPICAVHDSENWLCQLEHGDTPQSRFEMVGGQYQEIEACATDSDHMAFYQVPMWHWWFVWLREKLT